MSVTASSESDSRHLVGANPTASEIDLSCRLPLLALFGAAAFWLVVSSLFGLLSSLFFHIPGFLADCAWLTYGRVRPVASAALLYGFVIPSGLGVGIWILTRLGRIRLVQPFLVTVGVKLWNIGVVLGVLGILAGDGTGFEFLDVPPYASLFLFLGYLVVAVFGLLTFYRRRQATLFISQWFIVAAILWFPWIFISANCLLILFPVRGVTQAVIAWWYAGNLLWVWLSLIGLAVLFYFIPKFTRKDVSSHYLALFTFWLLLVAGSWAGIPNSAPVPVWIPSASTVGTVLCGIAILTFAMNLHQTLEGQWSLLKEDPALRFFGFAVVAFLLAWLLNITSSISRVADVSDLTWFSFGRNLLQIYGFAAIALLGAIYHIVPQLLGVNMEQSVISPGILKLAKANFGLSALGILLIALPLVVGGLIQGLQLNNATIPFLDITKTALMAVRLSTVGDLLVLLGNAIFMLSLGRMVADFYKARAKAAYVEVTAVIPAVGVKP